MSARIAEIKRQLRAYGAPVGIRVMMGIKKTSKTLSVRKRTTLKAAWLSINPDPHLKSVYYWISKDGNSIGKHGATWEQSWEKLLAHIRRKLLKEIRMIERERHFEGKKYF